MSDKALLEVLAGPVAAPRRPGVRFGRYRTVAFDGCVSFKVADSDRNWSWLGKLKAALSTTGYPVIRLMTVVETGTRALLGAVFGTSATGEIDNSRALFPLLNSDMLVLADRGFDAEAFLTDLAGTGAKFLVRLRNNRHLPVLVSRRLRRRQSDRRRKICPHRRHRDKHRLTQNVNITATPSPHRQRPHSPHRAGPFSHPILSNPNDATIGKFNDGQQHGLTFAGSFI